MKMKLPSFILTAACTSALLGTSCADNINSYDSSVIPIGDEVYYIAGRVTDNVGNPIVNVEVDVDGRDAKYKGRDVKTDTDGYYILEIKEKKAYTLKFEEDGYIDRTIVADASSLGDFYSELWLTVTIAQATTFTMTDADMSIVATAREAGTMQVALYDESSIRLNIPRKVIGAGKKFSVAYFMYPIAPPTTRSQTIYMTLAGISLRTSAKSFEKPGIELVANPRTTVFFPTLLLSTSATRMGEVALNEVDFNYSDTIQKPGDWAFLAQAEWSAGSPANTTILEKSFNNLASSKPIKGDSLSCNYQTGWEVEACTPDSLTEYLTTLIANYKGGDPEIYTQSKTLVVNVPAESILSATCMQNFRTDTYAFNLVNTQGESINASIQVTEYTGLSTSFTTTTEQHSGGAGE